MKFGAILNQKGLTTGKTRTPPRALSSASLLFKSVCLHDWWLIKPPEGEEGLAVAGFSSREGRSVRAFKSAAISKRLDATTLETVDSFTISLVGFINRDLTQQNGFSPEVYSHFQFGFSYDWEEYTVKSSNGVRCSHTNDLANHTFKTRSSSKRKGPQLEDLPVTRDHDPRMRSHQESDRHIPTMKAVKDLFECARDLKHNESLSPSKDNNVTMSEGVTMAPDGTQLTNSFTCFRQGSGLAEKFSADANSVENSVKLGSFNGLPGSAKPGQIDRHSESDHMIIPTKRKFGKPKVAEGSFDLGGINSESANRTVPVESPTTCEAGVTPRTINHKPARGRRITRSMTKEKSDP